MDYMTLKEAGRHSRECTAPDRGISIWDRFANGRNSKGADL